MQIIEDGDSYIPWVKTVTNLPGGDKIKAAEREKRLLNFLPGK